MQVIDFHVHPFRVRGNCLNFYPEMADLDALGMKAQLERAGISRICGSVLDAPPRVRDFGDLQRLNREALALREILGDFYVPGFHIHPGYREESCREVEAMHRRGVKLMGELVPYMHGWGEFDPDSWMEIMDLANEYGMLCSYHTPFDFDMEDMLRRHPNVTFIAAHPGDRDRVEEHIQLMKHHDNLCLDLSGTGLFRLGLLKHLIAQVGADRILFGTDYPICNPEMYLHGVLGEDISEEDKEKVLHRNAERLLR